MDDMASNVRRINLYGGPCAGKSTVAADVFSFLKKTGKVEAELVQEYVKTWAYENRPPKGFDQVYLFSKQLRKEDVVLRNGVDVLITDSPLLLGTAYAREFDSDCWRHLAGIHAAFEARYPSLNIFVLRSGGDYRPVGRFEDEAKAVEMDERIRGFLREQGTSFWEFSCKDGDVISAFCYSMLGLVEVKRGN